MDTWGPIVESSDVWLIAWEFSECVLIRSSTLRLLPFTAL